ncbi:MAG: hypothetical protein WCO89_06760, partial [Syntrophus sp. (in: bacteria)]
MLVSIIALLPLADLIDLLDSFYFFRSLVSPQIFFGGLRFRPISVCLALTGVPPWPKYIPLMALSPLLSARI